MEKIAVENINGLIFEGKAIPLAGFSSTQGAIHQEGFRTICKFIARWQGQ